MMVIPQLRMMNIYGQYRHQTMEKIEKMIG